MKNNFFMNIGIFKNILLGSAILLFSLSSITSLFKEKEFITQNIKKLLPIKSDYQNNMDEFWAKEILSGGYILFFRHAERYKPEPFQQLQVYDAYEVNNNLKGENTYFAKFVCFIEWTPSSRYLLIKDFASRTGLALMVMGAVHKLRYTVEMGGWSAKV